MILVTSHTDNKFFIIKDGNRTEYGLNSPRGADILQNLIAIAHSNQISVYDSTNLDLIKNIQTSFHVHEICITQSEGIVACDQSIPGLAEYSENSKTRLLDVFNENFFVVDKAWVSGMCVDESRSPTHVTVLGVADGEMGSWRESAFNSKGRLVDAKTGEILVNDLFFPHSPRMINNKLMFLDSGNGNLCVYEDGRVSILKKMDGWLRGMAQVEQNTIMIGQSARRHTALDSLRINDSEFTGIAVVDISTMSQIDFIPVDVHEIFDVKVMSNQ